MKLSQPQQFLLTSGREIGLFLAGIGSGKTHTIGNGSYSLLSKFPGVRGFVGANTHNQLTTSTMFRVRQVWEQFFGLKEGRDYVVGKRPPTGWNMTGHNFNDYGGILSFRNGAVVFIGSLENAKAHDGKEFGWAMLDETKDTREEDVREIILTRIRQPGIYIGKDGRLSGDPAGRPFNPLRIFTSPAKIQWLNDWFEMEAHRPEIEAKIFSKTEFFAKEWGNKCCVVSSTWHNADNLPATFIPKILAENPEERAKALIYGNPFTRTGGEFYSGFSSIRHKGPVEFRADLPLHVSFDQNVVPYITATCWQIVPEGEITWLRQVDEFCLPNPNNTTERLCEAIAAKYGSKLRAGLFFYGDASGNARSTKGPDTDYTIVRRVLRPWLNNRSDRTARKNPGVLERRDFVNALLEGKTRYRVLVGEHCPNTLADMTYLKQDINGAKNKERGKDPVSGNSFEKYGHTSDANDYFFCEALRPDFDKFRGFQTPRVNG